MSDRAEGASVDLRLVALSGAAGCLDATSFLRLDEIFPANQTGNTVLLGIAIGRGDWSGVAHSGMALLAFCVGVLALGFVLRDRPAGGWTPAISAALWVEAAMLVVLAIVWRDGGVVLAIALAASAMGVQSLAAQRVGVPGVSTTFVTGTLTRLSSRLAGGHANLREDGTPALVWVSYLVGAIGGGLLASGNGGHTGVLVVAALVAAVAGFGSRAGRPATG